VRRFPLEEARAIDEELARLKGKPHGEPGKAAAHAAVPNEAPPPRPAPGGATC